MNTITERLKRMIKLKQLTKTIILTGMLLLLGRSAFAQSETVTVGAGTTNSRDNGSPFYDYSRNSTTAAIYTSAEIGQSGCITEIAYNRASGTAFTGEVHIYMATLNKTTFSGNNDWPTTYTEVYSNSSLLIGSNGWNTLTLSTPYYYDQSAGSLVVIVTKATTTRRSQYWYYTSATNTVLHRNSGNTTNANYSNVTNTNNGTRGSNRPNIRLTFKRFYFSANATATPSAGGSASVSPTTTNVIGTTGCDNATTTATFSATPNTGYRFLGWSETASGTIISTDNPYVATITSTSTSSSNPTNTTLYAQFELIPNATAISASNTTVYVGNSGSVGYTLTPSNAYDQVRATSGNTDIFTVNASPVSGGTVAITPVGTGQATLTLVALNVDGTDGPSTTVTVTIKNKVATPTIAFEPIGNGSTATATITSTTGADIYYTVNGATPTTSSTPYTASFTVNDGDVVRAIAVMTGNPSWDNSEVAIKEYHNCGTNDPTITYVQSGTTATVTITAESGATIYYTIDGSNPNSNSASGTTIVTLTSVADGTNVKAYAKNPGCVASNTVSKEIVLSGISGGVVTLNDREDHSWSYYSDASTPSQLHSLSPADVKITYYGDGIVMTGDDDYTASSVAGTNYITPGNENYVGGAKVNVGGENENTFVYYKTLERGDATQTAWTFSSGNQSSAASRCPYTPIPNPFQVRPTYGGTETTNTADWSGWRGFQCWRLKRVSGGAVYSAASGGSALSVGAVINAETEIYFAPNSEYGMEVDFEAVWARAYVVKASDGGANAIGDHGSLGYERNFIVLNTYSNTQNVYYNFGGTSGKRITNIDRQVTVSRYLPNGVRGQNNDATYVRGAGGANMTLQANTKFENVAIYDMSSYTLSANGHDLIVGRGVTGTVNNLCGLNANQSTGFRFRIESGSYNNLYFMNDGYALSAGIMVATMGCDYDRATGANNNLSINTDITVAKNATLGSSNNKGAEIFNCTVKSGNFDLGTSNYAGSNQFYLSNWGSNNYIYGKRKLTVEGGIFSDIAGGMDDDGTETVTMVEIRIKGGTMNSVVYGAAQRSDAQGHRIMIITGGLFKGWIAGGANGNSNQDNSNGEMIGNTYIYVGGNAEVNSNGSNSPLNRALGGNVFGAGCGYGSNYSSGLVTGNTNVVIADNAYIERGVYGGGSYGYTTQTANIYILGGHVEGKNGGVSGTLYSESITGGVFGGACQNQGGTVNITMTDGLVKGGVYGGSNATGTLSGSVTMNINGGQVGTSSTTANVHGGGYGQNTVIAGNVDLTLGTLNQTEPGVTVYGDVYGGSALGSVNGTSANTTYHTNVTLNAGTINGSLYGGALGDLSSLGDGHSNVAANVYGPVTVTVNGGSVRKTDANGANGSGAVYGCNNINGAPQRAVAVVINGTDPAPSSNEYALYAVYGGGNKADYSYGTPTVTVNYCDNSIEYVYGGGNAAHITNGNTDVKIYGGNIGNVFGGGNGTVDPANVSGNTNVKIIGGNIGRVFGGSNSQGQIDGTINVTVEYDDNGENCPMHIGEVYGGGNKAPSYAGNITIGCMRDGDIIDYVYGGSNDADVTDNVNLLIEGGRINNVFGGNNNGHTIIGTITVTVDWGPTGCSSNYLGNVFGGGNLANYTAPSGNTNYPQVFIKDAIVSGNVFGGGNGDETGEKGWVEGNPQVVIGDLDSERHVIVRGNVYGGGNAAEVRGDTKVIIRARN